MPKRISESGFPAASVRKIRARQADVGQHFVVHTQQRLALPTSAVRIAKAMQPPDCPSSYFRDGFAHAKRAGFMVLQHTCVSFLSGAGVPAWIEGTMTPRWELAVSATFQNCEKSAIMGWDWTICGPRHA
nr:hypothetical protein [Candidatus Rhodobacter lobularis]